MSLGASPFLFHSFYNMLLKICLENDANNCSVSEKSVIQILSHFLLRNRCYIFPLEFLINYYKTVFKSNTILIIIASNFCKIYTEIIISDFVCNFLRKKWYAKSEHWEIKI